MGSMFDLKTEAWIFKLRELDCVCVLQPQQSCQITGLLGSPQQAQAWQLFTDCKLSSLASEKQASAKIM